MRKRTKVAILATLSTVVASIAGFEGFSNVAYLDSGGTPTIGFGQTRINGAPVKLGDEIAVHDAISALNDDALNALLMLYRLAPDVELTDGETQAYADFIYQFGVGAFKRSTMLKLINAGKKTQACQELLRWRFVKGKDCKIRSNNCYGVYRRSVARYETCLGGASV